MSLQDITAFKQGTLFNALIHAYGNIRIGIEAYGQLIAKNLNDVLEVMDEALYADLNSDQLSGCVMVPLYADATNKIGIHSITKRDLARCLQNDGEDFQVYLYNVAPDNSIQPAVGITSSGVVDNFSRYLDQCAGMKSLVNQIVNSDFNLTVSQLYSTTIKGGSEVSEWLSNLIENCSGSTNVLKVLASLLSHQSETPDTASDYIFNADFTGGSSLVVGFTAIANDIATFFDSLDFSILKFGESFKQLGLKIFDAIKYLLSSAFVELDQHFVLNDNAKFETCDVPIVYDTFPASDLVSFFPMRFISQRYYFDDNSGYVDAMVDTTRAEQLEAKACVIQLLQSIVNNGNLVLPIAGNFVLLSLPNGLNNSDILESDVYCGVYPIGLQVPFLDHQYKASIINGVITPASSGPIYPLMESMSQSNTDVVNFIAKSISHDSSTTLPDVPFGSNLETPNLFGNVVARSITLDNPTKGSDLLDAYTISGCGNNSTLAQKFGAYAVIYYCIANNFLSYIPLTAEIYDSANQLVKSISVLNPGFLPYCHTDTFECYVHAQTDTERANEVKDLLIKVLIAAAAVAGTTLAVKTRKKLKLRAKSKRAEANAADRMLQFNPNNTQLAEYAVRASKVADRAEALSNILNPIGVATTIFSVFNKTSPNTNQEVRDNTLRNALSRLETKYNDDDIVKRIQDLEKLIH